MPTKEEQDELRTKCYWTWTTSRGVNGYVMIGPNGNSIFLPAAGYRGGSSLYRAGSYGYYWSSLLDEYNSYSVRDVSFGSGSVDGNGNYNYRCCGRSVRPVCP